MLGPRKDFKRVPIVPHNVPLVLLGAGLLWFGWFGFNAGSALAANGLAAIAFTNTNTAAATALVTWAALDVLRTGKATAVGAATGLVVGLVGITPAAGYISAPASLAVGALSALVSYTAIQIRATTRLDDSLDVFSCHGLAGVAGAMLTGVFASKAGNPARGDGWPPRDGWPTPPPPPPVSPPHPLEREAGERAPPRGRAQRIAALGIGEQLRDGAGKRRRVVCRGEHAGPSQYLGNSAARDCDHGPCAGHGLRDRNAEGLNVTAMHDARGRVVGTRPLTRRHLPQPSHVQPLSLGLRAERAGEPTIAAHHEAVPVTPH